MSFIVRTAIDDQGRLHGSIQHVQTGRKERFIGAAQLGEQIATMTAASGEAASALARLEGRPPGKAGADEGQT